MRLSALVEAGDPQAIDVYLCEQDAQRAVEDCLRDEPEWRGVLEVKEIELDHEHRSLNLVTSTRRAAASGAHCCAPPTCSD
jgi:hypothetical protein